MSRALFHEWLGEFNDGMERQKRKVALVLDNCSAHHSMPDMASVEVFFLPPNTTAGLQPMDAGVIANFKVLYRRRVLDRLLLNVDNAARGSQEPDLKITLLMATQFIFGAWCGVRASTVRNCFRQAGFVRRRHEEEAGEEEAIPGEATEAPDDEGVPQLWSALHEDASGLDDFLHADDGVETSECLSDEAIVASVRGAADSGESDDDDDAAEQPTQVPSSHEAQRMIQSLRDFIFAKDLPLSYVEQLDALEKDVRQLRVKQSKLTDYGFSANE